MIKSFDFFFDFISPYSYLAHKQIRHIEFQHKIEINYMPILLGGLLKLAEIKAPAFIPSKAKFMIKDCKLFSEKFNIKFKFNSYFSNTIFELNERSIDSQKRKQSKFVYRQVF